MGIIMLCFYALFYYAIPPKFYIMLLHFSIMLTIAFMPTVLYAESY